MKWIMRVIRAIVGPILLLLDAVFAPKSVARQPESQAKVDSASQNLKLYQFLACPFCVRVRRGMKRLALPIETRDTKRNEQWREELLREGGSPKVPCLRIEESGDVRWLYESKAINEYLESRFAV
jgi:glutaredoxin